MDKILKKAKCGLCEKPMKSSRYINIVQLPIKQTWQYPQSGNVFFKTQPQASAVLCDACIDRINDPDDWEQIKYVIEIEDNKVVYHDTATLEKFKPKTCKGCNEEILEMDFPVDEDRCFSCLGYI